MKKAQGFTLIEILVAIGVVGILSAILIMSLVSARNKAKDASMKNIMNEPLAIFSIEYYISHTNYGAFCNQPEVIDFLSQINSSNTACNVDPNGDPSTIKISKICCHHNANIWVVCAQLFSSSSKAWCSDNTGVRKEIDIDACKQSITSCNG
ncbi:MAG: type II secretion system protein [Candidatus Staskawiczbacteria bacterium]|nr:type II secretion system protein [Candidatus Staskawiczbacteria bacterium]